MTTLSPLLLLPLLLVGLGSSVEILENGYPIMWGQAPDQVSLLPKVDNVVIINPWNYLQRMGLYRLLLAATQPYMASMGPKDTDNPLWALPIELGWKLRSGRLLDPTGASKCGTEKDPMCISPHSWWGCMDYQLLVIPFMAAVQKGIIGGVTKVQVQIPDVAVEDYCTSHADCTLKHPEPMAKWEAFFQALKEISQSNLDNAEKKDKILGNMWEAKHASRFVEVPATCQNKETYYPKAEITFAKDLIQSIEYVAVTNYHSNIDNIMIFMAILPSRVLQDTDVAPNIPDLSQAENHSLFIQSWRMRMDSLLGDTILRMWTSAMCSQTAREKAQEILRDMNTNSDFNTFSFFTVLTEMIYSCFSNQQPNSRFNVNGGQLLHTEF